ncbi:hypothetical protein B0H12DRAFT_1235946 [Mycena haematopus]|nr:hypothetical protein B0H12DRAFT_1235946 [Mycena haematopus]
MSRDPRSTSIAIVGAGAAGLITAYTLLQDGFSQVQLFTKDSTVGGVWSAERVYPGLEINNVHGEYHFSAMEMPKAPGERIMGQDLREYMEALSNKFKHIIRLNTEVINIRRDETTSVWFITVEDKAKSSREVLEFSRIVLCTGGCHVPRIPENISMDAAKKSGFQGPVIHSRYFASRLDTILEPNHKSIVIVGGGKSAQEQVAFNSTRIVIDSGVFSMAAYLANAGKKVTVVFTKADAFLASSTPLPGFIRKSRHATVHPGRAYRSSIPTGTGQQRFGDFTVLARKDSPMRNINPLFWTIHVNDEGLPRPNRFFTLVNAGDIEVIAPARVQGFGPDGKFVTLSDGRAVNADLVLLATGYTSSWANIFDEDTEKSLGMNRHPPGSSSAFQSTWDNYLSLANPPPSHPESEQWASSIYNGIVPAKNIARRDFAINGSVFTPNVGYTWEVVAHWISAYFLADEMNIPKTPEEAYEQTERQAAWIRKRHPDGLLSQVFGCGVYDRLINILLQG